MFEFELKYGKVWDTKMCLFAWLLLISGVLECVLMRGCLVGLTVSR